MSPPLYVLKHGRYYLDENGDATLFLREAHLCTTESITEMQTHWRDSFNFEVHSAYPTLLGPVLVDEL